MDQNKIGKFIGESDSVEIEIKLEIEEEQYKKMYEYFSKEASKHK